MLFIAVLAWVAGAAAQSLPAPADPTYILTHPEDCTNWPEERVWIDAQQWWTDAGQVVESESRHWHIGACMPYNLTLTGNVTIDVVFQLHNNLQHRVKEIYFLAPLPFNSSGIVLDTTNRKIGSSGDINMTCDKLTCLQVFRIQVDTSLVPFDCVAPLRIRAESGLREGVPVNLTIGNGYTYAQEMSVMVRYANGHPACPARMDPNLVPELPTSATGFNDFPWSYTRMSILRDTLPRPSKPVCGNWTVRQLESFDQRFANRITPVVAPVTRSFVSLNPRFHVVNPATGMFGYIIGSVQLDVPDMIRQNLVVDTTKLPNGRNRFFFRTDAYIAPNTTFPDNIPWLPGVNHTFSGGLPHPGGTSSATLVFNFWVNNTAGVPCVQN